MHGLFSIDNLREPRSDEAAKLLIVITESYPYTSKLRNWKSSLRT